MTDCVVIEGETWVRVGAADPGLEEWIRRNFSGLGRAIREEHEEPYEGEPYMSMEEAKTLVRQAVAVFCKGGSK